MFQKIKTWWHLPAGGREVLQVSIPLVISSLSWTVMSFIDRVFLKWLSGDSMTAAFSASMVWFVLLCLPLGVCAYANTSVSQYFGDKQYHRIGLSVWQAIWVGVMVSPLILACSPLAPWVFELAGHEPSIRAEEIRYFQALNWGAGGMLVSQAAAAFYSGRGKTHVMIVDSFLPLNVLLDYAWIFGHSDFGRWNRSWMPLRFLWLKAFTYVLLMLQSHHRVNLEQRLVSSGLAAISSIMWYFWQ